MSPDAFVASGGISPGIGSDIVFLSDVFYSKNFLPIPVTGTHGLLIDNQSAAKILIQIAYGGSTGIINLIVQPWQPVPIIAPDVITSIAVINLTDGPLPNDVLSLGVDAVPTRSGFLIITAVTDVTSILKMPSEKRAALSYNTVIFTIAANAHGVNLFYNAPPGLPYTGGNFVQSISNITIWASRNNTTQMGIDIYCADTLANHLPPNNSGGKLNPLWLPPSSPTDYEFPITFDPGDMLSMDVDYENKGYVFIVGTNYSASAVSGRLLIRGR